MRTALKSCPRESRIAASVSAGRGRPADLTAARTDRGAQDEDSRTRLAGARGAGACRARVIANPGSRCLDAVVAQVDVATPRELRLPVALVRLGRDLGDAIELRFGELLAR
jgi:hypothetical protein